SAVARTVVRAGLAAIFISSPVAGLRPSRALRAGFLTRRILTPVSGIWNSPEPRLRMCPMTRSPSAPRTAETSFLVSPVDSEIDWTTWLLVCLLATAGAFLVAALLEVVFFFTAISELVLVYRVGGSLKRLEK